MQKKSKKKLSAFLLALLIAMAGSGCASEGDQSNGVVEESSSVAEGSNSEAEESDSVGEELQPVVTALLSGSQLPAEENSVLTEIRNRTGIDFQPLFVEGGAYTEKYNTMAAAGILPDIFSNASTKAARELVENGVIMQLDSLLQEYGQEIVENRGDQFADSAAMIDGKLYGIPTKNFSTGNALMVRKDWLDNLGMEIPTTAEEFYEVAKAFTYDDPDQNGQDDTIAIAAAMSFSTTLSFLYGIYGVPYQQQCLVDGRVVPYYMHPNYLEAVQFIRKLYEEGLMEPDLLTIPNMSCLEKLWNGTYGFYYGDPTGTTNNWYPGRYTEDPLPVMTYTWIEGPDGSAGSPIAVDTSFICINAKAEHPDAAMKLLNFLCSEEGNQLSFAGVQGVHWDWDENGGIVYLDKYADSSEQRNDGVYCYWPMLRYEGFSDQLKTEITQYGYKIANEHNCSYAYLPETPEAADYISFNADEMFSSLLLTSGDMQAEYDEYIQDYLDNGGTEYIEEATDIYNAQ